MSKNQDELYILIRQEDQSKLIDIKNDCFSLYQLTTLWFSWHAFRDKGIRKTMGIKKGLFDF